MLTATLGGLIKDYRIKKRLSQLEVALRIGWKDTSRLSKIEQGRVGRPTRETIEKISKALELDSFEQGQLLYAANLLPTREEAQKVIKYITEDFSYFKYPAFLIDMGWNIFYFNNAAKELFKLSDQEYEYIEKECPNWMEIQFLKKYFNKVKVKAGYTEKKLLPFEEYLIAHFKFEQLESTSERWFNSLLTRLSKDPLFRELWVKTPVLMDEHLFYEYEVNEFTGVWKEKEQNLKFHIISLHPNNDSRYGYVIHMPADAMTYDFYNLVDPIVI